MPAGNRTNLIAAVIVLGALALRVPGIFHDFWLDEVWSVGLLERYVKTPLDILTRIPLDNNHPLNTFFLYVIGPRSSWYVYRLPSLILGTATVLLAGRIMQRHGRPQAVIAMLLVSCCYPLVVYASEARGYAPMTFFLLLTVYALDRWLNTRAPAALALFWLAVMLGTLAHLTFVQGYGAVLLWSGYELTRRHAIRVALRAWVACHALPLLFLVLLYFVYVSRIQVAGAESAALVTVLGDTAAVALGFPDRWPWTLVASVTFMAGLIYGLREVSRSDRGAALLFLAGIVLIPALMVAGQRHAAIIEPRFFPRYFLVGITLFLLVASWAIGARYTAGGSKRTLAIGVLAAYIVGSLGQVGRFIEGGRGHYRDAVLYMAAETHNASLRVSSNSDVRTPILLGFYGRYLPAGANLVYYPHSRESVEVEWHIVEDLEPVVYVPRTIRDAAGREFELLQRFPFYGLSGCQWTLYRRVNRSEAPRPAPIAPH